MRKCEGRGGWKCKIKDGSKTNIKGSRKKDRWGRTGGDSGREF